MDTDFLYTQAPSRGYLPQYHAAGTHEDGEIIYVTWHCNKVLSFPDGKQQESRHSSLDDQITRVVFLDCLEGVAEADGAAVHERVVFYAIGFENFIATCQSVQK